MKKIDMKKITIVIALLLIASIIVLIIFSKDNKIRVKEFSNKVYTFKYDSSWSLYKNDNKKVILKHSNNGLINIEVKELTGNYKYQSIDSLKDDLVSSIQDQNKDYKLIAEDSTIINKVHAYKLLFERNDNQVLVIIMKQQNSLIIYTYEANNDYFDILLDSALNIVYNFKLSLDVSYNTKLDNIKITGNNYSGKDKVSSTTNYTIHNNNYSITYSIPSDYKLYDFDSTFNIYNKGDRSITTSVYYSNIYEVLESNLTGIEYKVNSLKKNYTDVKYTVDKGNEDNSYIYQITYKYKDTKYEDIYMLYTIDNSHTFYISIKSTNNNVSKEFIDSIKIIKKERYAENITINKEGNYNIANLKQKVDSKDEYYDLKLYVPLNYIEQDHGNNMYERKYFSTNYNNITKSYNFNYTVEITNVCPSTKEELLKSSSYISYKLDYSGIKKYNNNNYYQYNLINNNKYLIVLVKPLNNDKKCVKLTYENNGSYVSNNVINSLSKYNLEVRKRD